jgi:hypothetical protein
MTRLAALLLGCLPIVGWAADDPRISFLEQEVRNLQRQVQALTRQLDALSTRPARPAVRPNAARPAPVMVNDTWLDSAKWRSLRAGMSELEVIELLGSPSSMREEDGARVLLYAMEIGASGFLSGSVLLRDRLVAEVRVPELR